MIKDHNFNKSHKPAHEIHKAKKQSRNQMVPNYMDNK